MKGVVGRAVEAHRRAKEKWKKERPDDWDALPEEVREDPLHTPPSPSRLVREFLEDRRDYLDEYPRFEVTGGYSIGDTYHPVHITVVEDTRTGVRYRFKHGVSGISIPDDAPEGAVEVFKESLPPEVEVED